MEIGGDGSAYPKEQGRCMSPIDGWRPSKTRRYMSTTVLTIEMIRRGQGDEVESDAGDFDCESQVMTSQRDETVEKICSIEFRSLIPPRQKVSWARCRAKRSWESCPYTVIKLFSFRSGPSSMYDC